MRINISALAEANYEVIVDEHRGTIDICYQGDQHAKMEELANAMPRDLTRLQREVLLEELYLGIEQQQIMNVIKSS